MAEHFHTIVIGAGSGGMTVAIGLANLGKQVAFVEGHHVGGDCTNIGCVPSKTLIHLAKNFKPGMNADDLLREVTCKRDALRDKETEEVQHIQNLTFLPGWAKFTAPGAGESSRWLTPHTDCRTYRHLHRRASAYAGHSRAAAGAHTDQ